MPLGINRVGSYRKGTKVSVPHEFGHLIDMPHEFGNIIEEDDLGSLQRQLEKLLRVSRRCSPEATTMSCGLGEVTSVGVQQRWYSRIWSRLRGGK